MTDSAAAVERMYRALVREIRTSRPELLDESFSVAEIYQNLVPYRTHRDVIGTEMSGDYEHVLMRLLVGEGDYVTLDSDTARRKLLNELDSIHPDTGLYRDFAACEVRLNQNQLPELEGGVDREGGNGSGPGSSEAPEPEFVEEDASTGSDGPVLEEASDAVGEPLGEAESVSGEGSVPREPVLFQASSDDEPYPSSDGDPASVVDSSSAAPEACRWCQGSLPERDDLQYCPHCGSHVDVRPCASCGAEVESGWSYCVACGSEAEA